MREFTSVCTCIHHYGTAQGSRNTAGKLKTAKSRFHSIRADFFKSESRSGLYYVFVMAYLIIKTDGRDNNAVISSIIRQNIATLSKDIIFHIFFFYYFHTKAQLFLSDRCQKEFTFSAYTKGCMFL